MINETKTLELFGYTSDSLSKGSHKKVWRICDQCGEGKAIRKYAYRNLCKYCGNKKCLNDKLICQEYMVGMSTIELGKKYNCDRYTITKRLHEKEINYKIKNNYNNKLICKDYLNGLTLEKIAEKYNYSRHLITNQLKSNGIKIRVNKGMKRSEETIKKMSDAHRGILLLEETKIKMSCTRQGISLENWDGFIKRQKYCYKFNDHLKEEIRNKYNNCDYISGLHKSICNKNKNLDVHHVDYNKQQGCEDHQWQLIPLSKSNHTKTNTNRSFWNRLFTYSLQYEKEYNEDE